MKEFSFKRMIATLRIALATVTAGSNFLPIVLLTNYISCLPSYQRHFSERETIALIVVPFFVSILILWNPVYKIRLGGKMEGTKIPLTLPAMNAEKYAATWSLVVMNTMIFLAAMWLSNKWSALTLGFETEGVHLTGCWREMVFLMATVPFMPMYNKKPGKFITVLLGLVIIAATMCEIGPYTLNIGGKFVHTEWIGGESGKTAVMMLATAAAAVMNYRKFCKEEI